MDDRDPAACGELMDIGQEADTGTVSAASRDTPATMHLPDDAPVLSGSIFDGRESASSGTRGLFMSSGDQQAAVKGVGVVGAILTASAKGAGVFKFGGGQQAAAFPDSKRVGAVGTTAAASAKSAGLFGGGSKGGDTFGTNATASPGGKSEFSDSKASHQNPRSRRVAAADEVATWIEHGRLLVPQSHRKTLKEVVLPHNVCSIGWGAFEECPLLERVSREAKPASQGPSACAIFMLLDLLHAKLPREDVLAIAAMVFPLPERTVAKNAFKGCTMLQFVELPHGITSIKERAFSGCTRLRSIEIPNSVTQIREKAFSGCKGLTSIAIPNSVTSIGYKAFRGSGLTSFIVPDSVTTIDQGVFYECSGLTSIMIPDSVTSIGTSAFDGCSGLTSVVIPNLVTSIGEEAFIGCEGLTSIVIPDSVTSIGQGAFSFSGLTSIVISRCCSLGDVGFSNDCGDVAVARR